MIESSISGPPADFRRAVSGLSAVRPRRGIEIDELAAPARLAPWTHAVSVAVHQSGKDESASGRLILLHDPAGVAAWDGTLRVVVFATSEVDTQMAGDPFLPEVAWSWLTDSLAGSGADFTALGGTVTATSSTRFGDIAGPRHAYDLEVRASWTARDTDTARHLSAFTAFLAILGDLPPEGIVMIGPRTTRSAEAGSHTK